jgi:hypothetical protein
MRVFQALQLGHLPSHLGLVPPHSVQVYWVLSLAMAQMILDKRTVFCNSGSVIFYALESNYFTYNSLSLRANGHDFF